MKKKIIVIVLISALILLFPFSSMQKDGGTKEYSPITMIYRITDYNRAVYDIEAEKGGRIKGTEIKIFGITVYKNTYFVPDK